MRFVIRVSVNTEAQNAPGGPDMSRIFTWSLYPFTGKDNQGNPAENSGFLLATGSSPSVDEAKAKAEAYASFYALETTYVYAIDPADKKKGV